MFVDEPAKKTKAVTTAPTVLNTSTELTAAVTAVPQPRVPLAEVLGSPDIISLEESMGINLFLYETSTELLKVVRTCFSIRSHV